MNQLPPDAVDRLVPVTRRAVLGGVAATGLLAIAGCSPTEDRTGDGGTPAGGENRIEQTIRMRVEAAESLRDGQEPEHHHNGDIDHEPPGVAAYSKGLRHDADGLPDPGAWTALVAAAKAGDFAALEAVELGGERRLVNPLGAFSRPLVGLDYSQYLVEAPPAVDDEEQTSELLELYWMALARDVPLSRWADDELIGAASADLDAHRSYAGRDAGARVTPASLFRGPGSANLTGPYISQFLWLRVPSGAVPVDQRIRAYLPGFDYLTTSDDWRRAQDGAISRSASPSTPRFARSLRDLASFVHRDFAFQAHLNAALIMLASSDDNDAVGITVPYAAGNPYQASKVQGPFGNLGQPQVLELLGLASAAALRAAWYQKWLVHWRIRPEELAGRVEGALNRGRRYPIPPGLADSPVLERLRSKFSSLLLPQAYPDGCPLHPSYPSGHATIAGACSTVLKACFDETFELTEPVVATEDGLGLQPWQGEPLLAGPELDKLATNIAYGRNAAGVHYRSDGDAGLRLGEAVAVSLLRDVARTFREPVSFTFTQLDGSTARVDGEGSHAD